MTIVHNRARCDCDDCFDYRRLAIMRFRIESEEGAGWRVESDGCTLAEILENNREAPEIAERAVKLAVGESFEVGGGADPLCGERTTRIA